MKKVMLFLSTLTLCSTSGLLVSGCNSCSNQQQKQEKVEFELISKIEIKKTYNNKFGIRFYKENTTEKGNISNDFWYLTDDGKYVAEFNTITNEAEKNIINTLRIKNDDYYPDFTLLKGWDLTNVTLTYKEINNQKEMINFNANLVADISVLLTGSTASIDEPIDREWIDNPNSNPDFTEKWWNFVKNNQLFTNKLKNIFINEVKKQINLNVTELDFNFEIWRAPSSVKTDISDNITSFVISIHIDGKNQLRNQYSYEVIIYNK